MSTPDTARGAARPLLDRFVPHASVRTQLVLAAVVWLVGASILIFRGVGYVSGRYWHAVVLGAALALAALKWRLLLEPLAVKAVARIRDRGNAHVLGFFSARSWMFVAVMMGGGIVLRRLVVHPGVIGAGIMGALYLGIGTALLVADRVFWHAVFDRVATGARRQA